MNEIKQHAKPLSPTTYIFLINTYIYIHLYLSFLANTFMIYK